jgi:hypothetical protein
LNKRRNLVSTSMAPMHVSDGRDSQGGQGAGCPLSHRGKAASASTAWTTMFGLRRNRSGRCVIPQRRLMMPYEGNWPVCTLFMARQNIVDVLFNVEGCDALFWAIWRCATLWRT